jgi:hypothetical protein
MTLLRDQNNIWTKGFHEKIYYPDEGLENLHRLEETSFWFRHRNNVITEVIKKYPFSGDFADVGGGNGFQLKNISNTFNGSSKYILIEPGYSGCMNAKKYGIEFIYNIPFQDFPFADFDIRAIGLFDVIEHIENANVFIAELFSKVRSGTKIYCTVPAYNILRSDVDDFGGHFRRYNNRLIKELAAKSGAKLLYTSYFFLYLAPLTFLLRAMPYRLGIKRPKEKIVREESVQHHPSSLVSGIFSFFEKKELKIISKSACRVGASCIFVLERP